MPCPTTLLVVLLAVAGSADAGSLQGYAASADPATIARGFATTAGDNSGSCQQDFLDWLTGYQQCTSGISTCCAPLFALGEACWLAVINSVQDAVTLDTAVDVFGVCGIVFAQPPEAGDEVLPSPSAAPPLSLVADAPSLSVDPSACTDPFNSAIQTCGTATSVDLCCTALSAMGAVCRDLAAQGMAGDPAYTDTLASFLSLLEQCSIAAPPSTGISSATNTATGTSDPDTTTGTTGTSDPDTGTGTTGSSDPDTGSDPGVSCVDLYYDAISEHCGDGDSDSECCDAQNSVGATCLRDFYDQLETPEAITPFLNLLDRCGISLQDRSPL
jgi:hypothetical protein